MASENLSEEELYEKLSTEDLSNLGIFLEWLLEASKSEKYLDKDGKVDNLKIYDEDPYKETLTPDSLSYLSLLLAKKRIANSA